VNQNKKPVVYTSSGCPKCSMLKNWLKNRGFEFEEKTLDTEVVANLVMKNIVVLSAPILEVEGTFYAPDQLFDGDRVLAAQLFGRLEG